LAAPKATRVHIPPPNLGGIKRRSIFSGTRPYIEYVECLKKSYNPPEADKRSRWDFLRRHKAFLFRYTATFVPFFSSRELFFEKDKIVLNYGGIQIFWLGLTRIRLKYAVKD
jgi:hypothetical protein